MRARLVRLPEVVSDALATIVSVVDDHLAFAFDAPGAA
jgi:hypothetical protein